MPTYSARSITSELCLASLSDTSTTKPHTQQSMETTHIIQRNATTFLDAAGRGVLCEQTIDDQDTGSHIRFLGQRRDMPFIVIHTRQEKPDGSVEDGKMQLASRRSKSPRYAEGLMKLKSNSNSTAKQPLTWSQERNTDGQTSPHSKQPIARPIMKAQTISYPKEELQALCLNIHFSRQCFAPSAILGSSKKEHIDDLQILAFVNGDLAYSHSFSIRRASPDILSGQHLFQLTGTRLGRLTEKPWIICSSPKRRKTSPKTALSRWTRIQESLYRQVELLRLPKTGNGTLSAEWLASLAGLQCPDEIKESLHFGCLDVLVIAGSGSKQGATGAYSHGPEHILSQQPPPQRSHPQIHQEGPGEIQPILAIGSAKKTFPQSTIQKTLKHGTVGSAPEAVRELQGAERAGLKRRAPATQEFPSKRRQVLKLIAKPRESDASDQEPLAAEELSSLQRLPYLQKYLSVSTPPRSSMDAKPNDKSHEPTPDPSTASGIEESPSLGPSRRRRVSQGSPLRNRLSQDEPEGGNKKVDASNVTSSEQRATPTPKPALSLRTAEQAPTVLLSIDSDSAPNRLTTFSPIQTRRKRSLTLRPPTSPVLQPRRPNTDTKTQLAPPPLAPTSAPKMKTTGKKITKTRRPSTSALALAPASAPPATRNNNNNNKNNNEAPPPASLAADRNFQRPILSESSVLNYAPEGIVRNVAAVKSATFVEKEIVFGCRYIIS